MRTGKDGATRKTGRIGGMSKEEDLDLLCDIVGSLAIDQFDDQEEYRAVINEIFYEWRNKDD